MIHVLTVAHPRFDTRIWIKEIQSLVQAGYEVKYHVADGLGDRIKSNVEIKDYGIISAGTGFWSRLKKMYLVTKRAGFKKGDWIHFHDGIFLPFAILLGLRGCRIIYDVHEDYPRQVLNSRFPYPLKKLWGWTISLLEWSSRPIFTGYISATPKIALRFPEDKTVTVQNFPLLSELVVAEDKKLHGKENYCLYVGGISVVRGIYEILNATKICESQNQDIKLALAGSYSPTEIREDLVKEHGWSTIEELGWLNREGVKHWMNKSRVGLVILHPTKNYPDAYPVKMFEYMSASLPVIASDFPLWREIVEDANAGLVVDPLDPDAIAKAILWIFEHPEEADHMGKSGRAAIENKFNWSIEKKKLLDFYQSRYVLGAGE